MKKDCSSLNYVAVKRVDYYWYSVEKQLRDYVRQPAVMTFLKAYGYQDSMSIMEMLEQFAIPYGIKR